MEKDLSSSQPLVNLIFLAGAPTFTLIPPTSQFLKFSTSFFLHGEYNSALISCVFALLERKTEIMHRRVWEKVRESVEITCQTAIRHLSINLFCYPITPLAGCFFHFSQCIWHRIQSGGQSTLYKDNETARSIFKMFVAFAFIQEDHVI
ncbi:hypothetical protein HZS_3512 [Henneguya salminicola]|nr:hypothetical protein HZS_3512 [Henneguya salminicola]